MRADFAHNLRLLCSYYRSIAEVCRKLAVNRPQFNRYLNGTTQPSRHMLRKICDFFGVEEYEIFLPHSQFAQIIRVKSSTASSPVKKPYVSHIDGLQKQVQGSLEKYLGYYFEYYYSMAFPGNILRALVHITYQEDGVYFIRLERLTDPKGKVYHCKYLGFSFYLGDRIFMLDYESLTGNEITQTVLYPTYKNRITRLSGLKLGVSSSDRREPACARVMYEALGQTINIRKALRLCGLYTPESEAIDEVIKEGIDNTAVQEGYHFLALPR